MGQWTIGLMYGCPLPEGVRWHGDAEPSGDGYVWKDGMEDTCRKAFAAEIEAFEKSGKVPRFGRAERRYVPDLETEQGANVLGFWVAAGASGKAGCPSLNRSVPVAEIRTCKAYRRAYKNARIRWRRFARWAATQGIALPKARLWLLETEVA